MSKAVCWQYIQHLKPHCWFPWKEFNSFFFSFVVCFSRPLMKLTCHTLSSKHLHLCIQPKHLSCIFTVAIDITCVSKCCFKEHYVACVGVTSDESGLVCAWLCCMDSPIVLLMYRGMMLLPTFMTVSQSTFSTCMTQPETVIAKLVCLNPGSPLQNIFT